MATLYKMYRIEGATLETLDFTIHIGSTPTFSYFDLSFNTADAAHYTFITVAYSGILYSTVAYYSGILYSTVAVEFD